MPELPEVEVITKELDVTIQKNCLNKPIINFKISKFPLREKISQRDLEILKGACLIRVYRRAKYLIFETTQGFLLNHLGMTGRWRIEAGVYSWAKHDHFAFALNDQKSFVYNDPRRFGLVAVAKDLKMFKQLQKLGPEPLSDDFSWDLFRKQLRKRKQNIKQVLMNPEVVVGVGNIYASEILFRSKVKPRRAAHRVTVVQSKVIFQQIQQVLKESIVHGGSTLKDYRRLKGEQGGFQNRHFVYGREDQPCFVCRTRIRAEFLAARSTFWCPVCQN